MDPFGIFSALFGCELRHLLTLPLFVLRFKSCCQRGYKAALCLAAFCSGHTESWIEEHYKKWCENSDSITAGEDEMAEDELVEQCLGGEAPEAEGDENQGNECQKILEQTLTETPFVDPEEGEEPKVPDEDIELAFEKVTDKADLEKLLHASADDKDLGAENKASLREKLPGTLMEAMIAPGDRFNALWRFSLRLRTARGGVDTKWLSNARNARKASKKLNWHQHLDLYYRVLVFGLCSDMDLGPTFCRIPFCPLQACKAQRDDHSSCTC